MRTFRMWFAGPMTIFALVVGGIAPASAARPSATHTKCRDVSALASGQGQFNADGSVDTTATVTKDPLLKGTLAGHFLVTGAQPPELLFAGDIVFTAKKKGTLTVQVTGAVNTATGQFQTSGPVTAGTEDFAGATGNLVITGDQAPTGAFTETIMGNLCIKN